MQRWLRVFAALLVIGIGSSLGASTFVAMSEKDLIASSDAVVRGQVVSVESFWNGDHTLIISEAVFEVESVIVGSASRYVTLRTAGGTVDENTVKAIGFQLSAPESAPCSSFTGTTKSRLVECIQRLTTAGRMFSGSLGISSDSTGSYGISREKKLQYPRQSPACGF